MTGPAIGKLPLRGARVSILESGKFREIEAEVYIHVKGYSLARVTHLDIESPELNRVYPIKGGSFLPIIGIRNGIEIRTRKTRIRIVHPLLNEVLNVGEYTRTWVGGKIGGIYIGFRKGELEKLEKICEEYFKFPVKKRSK